ncbi:DUF4168 domain-containing protein [Thiohalophilus sp.]|uniref:DUF4168 domain-containing protein n=1 Tax=Thiohalophilus sp. TaxID=3028392 RepID=UPI002ACE9D8B|nr:DUF4168 domain-containing protein [Thiohalophilus sp.]MDZ7804639.1 DUF4168 domain-containing protein [Thiohalophilus sp.]
MKFKKTALLVALFGMSLSLGAYAQDYGQGGAQQQQQQGSQAPANVDDASLNKFKDAFAEVNSIRESFAGKLENVEDPQKAQKLQQQAQQDMVSAVEDAGLSVQEYNQIFAAVQQNPELQKKVLGDR